MNLARCRRVAVAMAGFFLWNACNGTVPPTPPQFEPAESLLTIVAEFQRHRDADLYRFSVPRDVSGQNVFMATLVRLSNYETLYPNKYAEVIAYTRAQAYARLGDYATAARFCKQAEGLGGELRDRAAADLRIIEEFREATLISGQVETLGDFREALQARAERCKALAERYEKQPWLSMAKCEWEQAEIDLVEFLWANRQVIPNGPAEAFDALAALRNRHRESKNFYRHTLRLGDWAYEMAGEYAILAPPDRVFPPGRVSFVWEEFERWTTQAMDFYREVARSFGAEERTEAARKLAAVEAFVHRIRQQHR